MQNVAQKLQLGFSREVVSLIAKLDELLVPGRMKFYVKTLHKITQKCSLKNRCMLQKHANLRSFIVTCDIFKVLPSLSAVIVE